MKNFKEFLMDQNVEDDEIKDVNKFIEDSIDGAAAEEVITLEEINDKPEKENIE